MGFTLAQLRTEVREHLGVGDEFLTPDVDNLINRSWWEIQKKFKFRETDEDYTFSTVAGTREYDLPTGLSSIDRLSLIDTNDKHQQLIQVSLDNAIQLKDDDSSSEDQPIKYQRRGDKILLYPTPDDVYTIVLYYQATLADVLSGGPAIPQDWHEIILYGAVSRGHSRFGSIQKSSAFAQMQAALIASAIPTEVAETVDTRYAQVQVLRPRYP